MAASFLFPFPCLPGEEGRVLRTHSCRRGLCYAAYYRGLTYAVNFRYGTFAK